MECIAPHEITEEQLLAYGDGDADDSAIEHIGRCPYCTQRARALVIDQLALRILFHHIECPDAHTLGEFHLGLLSADEQAAIKDHLNSCLDCATEVKDLDHFLQDVPTTLVAPPVQRQFPKGDLLVRRLVARLIPSLPDPATQLPALALRGATAAPPDVYQAEDIKMVVGLEADGLRAGRKMLLGFTIRQGKPIESLTGARVQLSRYGQTVALEQVDGLGNFVFFDLTSGEYELVLFTDREQVVIETIVI
jgi:hypothetical protein